MIKAEQSFVNAGYSKEEVVAAANRISATDIQKKVVTPVNPLKQLAKQYPEKEKQPPKTMKIILIILSILVLIGATLFGIFWRTILR